MFDARVERYASRDRFADAVLGLLSLSERTCAIAAIPGEQADVSAECPIGLFLLGLISLRYTLRARLACSPSGGTEAAPSDAEGLGPEGLLR